jgi:hypothetical protein
LRAIYEQYKEDHSNSYTKEFLREHEHDMWFLEKYNPLYRYANYQRAIERARRVDVYDDYIDPNHLTLVY